MIDSRFGIESADTSEMLAGVDFDEIGDVETLYMFLFRRPIGVEELWDGDGVTTALEVQVSGDESVVGVEVDFPMTILDLTRACADTCDEVAYTPEDDEDAVELPDVTAMSDEELLTALQQALGGVRMFNAMNDEA